MIHEHDYHANHPLQSYKPYVAFITFEATIEIPFDARDDADATRESESPRFLTDALNDFTWTSLDVTSFKITHIEEDDTK